jgi:hypothetical protein
MSVRSDQYSRVRRMGEPAGCTGGLREVGVVFLGMRLGEVLHERGLPLLDLLGR